MGEFEDLIAAGKEMEALDAGTLPGMPNAAPVAPPDPVLEPTLPAAPVAPMPEPAPVPVAPAPVAPGPVALPATREEYDRAMAAPAAPAPVAPAAPAPTAPPLPAGFPSDVPGQAVPYERFDEVRRAAAQLRADNEALTRRLLVAPAAPAAPAAAAVPPEYNPQVAALVSPVIAAEVAAANARLREEIAQTYGLNDLREERSISECEALAPGYRAAHGQVSAYYETLPPEQQARFSGIAGAISLMTIMEKRGMLRPSAPAPAAAPAAPQYVGPAPVLAPSTARAYMEVRPGREPVVTSPAAANAATINNMSEAQFEAYKEALRNGGAPPDWEPHRLLR